MIITKLNIDKVFFTDTNSMPMHKFNSFLNHMILDNCVGGGFDDIIGHIKKIYAFVNTDKKDHAIKQIHNLHQCLHNVEVNNNPKKEALKFLLKKEDDLKNVSHKALLTAYEDLKKKFLLN